MDQWIGVRITLVVSIWQKFQSRFCKKRQKVTNNHRIFVDNIMDSILVLRKEKKNIEEKIEGTTI